MFSSFRPGLLNLKFENHWSIVLCKTRVVSTRRRVPSNWVSGRTLQPSIETVVANSFVPSDFLMDGQVSGMGDCAPPSHYELLWHMDSSFSCSVSTLKRKSSSSTMDGLQRRRRRMTTRHTSCLSPLNELSISIAYLLLSLLAML